MANFLFGTQDKFERVGKYSPGQEGALDQLLKMGLGGLQQGQAGFAPIEAHARKQYQEETIPSLAQRFTSMGAQRSSGFQDALARSGEHLESSLGAARGQFDLQNRSQLMQLLGMGLTQREEPVFMPGKQGFLGQAGAGLLQGLGSLIPLLGGLGGGAQSTSQSQGDKLNQIMKLLGMLGSGQQGGGQSGSIAI